MANRLMTPPEILKALSSRTFSARQMELQYRLSSVRERQNCIRAAIKRSMERHLGSANPRMAALKNRLFALIKDEQVIMYEIDIINSGERNESKRS